MSVTREVPGDVEPTTAGWGSALKVLQLHTPYRHTGGEDTAVHADLRLLKDAGVLVHQHLSANPSSPLGAAAALAVSAWNPAAAQRVHRLVRELRPDLMHVHNTWFAGSPSLLAPARRHGVPVVMTVHNYRLVCANGLFLRDGMPCEDCLHHGSGRAVAHACYRSSVPASAAAAFTIGLHRGLRTWQSGVSRFLVLSDFARARLVEAGIPEGSLRRIDNFVHDPGPRLSRASESNEVLFVGRLAPEKGVAVLLEAWRRRQHGRELRLSVIGDGPDRPALEAAAPAGVVFHGSLDRAAIYRRLLSARALVVPSVWYEGQPMVVLEALAAGVPVLLSDIGGLREVLGTHTAGLLALPRDPDSLGARLDELVDEESVELMSKAARDRYESRYTPAAALVDRMSAYRSALGTR